MYAQRIISRWTPRVRNSNEIKINSHDVPYHSEVIHKETAKTNRQTVNHVKLILETYATLEVSLTLFGVCLRKTFCRMRYDAMRYDREQNIRLTE